MKIRLISAIVFGLALTLSATAQDANPRGGRRGMGMGGMGMGNPITGTVTEVAADHYVIKTDAGESYTVHFSANTRMMKQMIQYGREVMGAGVTPPQPIKPTDIKVGDEISVMGEVDAAARSIGATVIIKLDPEIAKQLREMQANYGKSWLMGKVTAINETTVTLLGSIDNAAHSFVADENTTFRRHRDPITLADVQVGDVVRVEGALKDGVFVAASVAVMGMPQGGAPSIPRAEPPPPPPSARQPL